MKQVMMFGPNSLKQAKWYAKPHDYRITGVYRHWSGVWGGYIYRTHTTTRIVMQAPDRRHGVCSMTTALRLERQGWKAVA